MLHDRQPQKSALLWHKFNAVLNLMIPPLTLSQVCPFFFPSQELSFFPRHLRKPPWHRLSWGKKKRMVQLEVIACFSLLPCPRDFSRKLFHIIVIRRSNLLICMVAALLQAQGRENGHQQGAKCAFNLNNPFNLSSIMSRQLGALILLQCERSALEITSSRSRVGEVWSCRKVGSGWRYDRKNLRLVAEIESQERTERDILLPVSSRALREYITRSRLLLLVKQQTLNRIYVYEAGVDQVALKWPICKLAWRIMGVLFTAPSCTHCSHLPTFLGPNVLSNQGQWAGELN